MLMAIIVARGGLVPGFANQDALGRLLGFGGRGKLALGVGRGSLHLVNEFLHGTCRGISYTRHSIAGLGHAARNLGNVANHGLNFYEIGGKGVDGGLARLKQRLHLGKCRRKLVDSTVEFCHHRLRLGDGVVEVVHGLIERIDNVAGLAQGKRELNDGPHAGNGKHQQGDLNGTHTSLPEESKYRRCLWYPKEEERF